MKILVNWSIIFWNQLKVILIRLCRLLYEKSKKITYLLDNISRKVLKISTEIDFYLSSIVYELKLYRVKGKYVEK